ncbi:hydantoinase/oxoprolinase family protein [Planotetraspora sp. A-T 1434]|uniref:hydantoinase/oxoprolinase family protein n=1 Tax=Planotetraspora sp. A-T 1434 TaxID=2979219 RepID=UPI0021C18FC8|nr:hydantoinase/oxoprolinase family protein [Planotetraspora sp. A-T 1434]MCT9933124.1 hydantoinase/oxoprolinase family protein [Planotetraspora sp. A-T 1434]
MPGHVIAADVGGTFTDVVLVRPDGTPVVAKTLSTHEDPAEGILTGVRSVLESSGTGPAEVGRFVHATTLATNAILERTGARVAFVTTRGFRGLLALGRYARVEEDRFDILFEPPPPPVPLSRCFEVTERLDARGGVLVPLDEADVRRVAGRIGRLDVEAVAISLLHSYANPAHERRVAEILAEALPAGVSLAVSSEIFPESREYERATTTLMSAYVGPIMVRYLGLLERRLRDIGIGARVQVMESSGGVLSAALAGRRAVATIESGPAAGVVAAQAVGRRLGLPDVISFDMGGTTAKACAIRGGVPDLTREFHVGGKGSFGGRRAGTGVPIKIAAIDLAEVGAGGGSVAWVDEGGALRVGPRSAGSRPGPACYGLGGVNPTVTDANLLLGYLDPGNFAGGTLTLSPERGAEAIERVLSVPLGVTPEAAAAAVHDIANAVMAAAVHVVTVQRGIDPRAYPIVAMGGAGPMHAARVAERFGIVRIVVPAACGVGSAAGLLATDLATDRVGTRVVAHADADIDAGIGPTYARLTAEGLADLGVTGRDPGVVVERTIDIRYRGQAHDLNIALPPGELTKAVLDGVVERFYERYLAAYGIAPRDPVEFVGYRVRVTRLVARDAAQAHHVAPAAGATGATGGPARSRPAWFAEAGGFADTPVYTRAARRGLPPLAGPLLVEDAEATVVVPPRWTLTVDATDTITLSREPS